MLYRNESTREKTCSRQKKLFSEEKGWIFFKFQGGIDQEVGRGGGVDQHSLLGEITLCRGESFFKGGGLEECCPLWLPYLYFTCTFRICH